MNGDLQQPNQPSREPESAIKAKDSLLGTTLEGRFRIDEVIGTGGMSVVYRATQLAVNRSVAIKTIRMQLDTKPIYRERFQREIASLCALNHPNVVTVYDCLIGADDQPYVVMDYLRGRSLETLIKEDGPLDAERFARISVQVCSALDHAHKKGIVHRDLKPGNVVLIDDEMDFVKVVDFGLAKLGQESRKLTQSGELWGSPPYMSPEQCMGKSGDERSDIYSLGAVMYEMLTGKDPFFDAVTVFELIQRHVGVLPPAMNRINPSLAVPEKVHDVVYKALAKEPDDRYQTATELQEAIIQACASSGEHALSLTSHTNARSSSGQKPTIPPGGTTGSAPQSVNLLDRFNMALDPLGGVDPESAFASQAQKLEPANTERASAPVPQEAAPTSQATDSQDRAGQSRDQQRAKFDAQAMTSGISLYKMAKSVSSEHAGHEAAEQSRNAFRGGADAQRRPTPFWMKSLVPAAAVALIMVVSANIILQPKRTPQLPPSTDSHPSPSKRTVSGATSAVPSVTSPSDARTTTNPTPTAPTSAASTPPTRPANRQSSAITHKTPAPPRVRRAPASKTPAKATKASATTSSAPHSNNADPWSTLRKMRQKP